MSNSHLTPHDRFFRTMMANPKIIGEFFEQNLPKNIKSVIDFATIQLQKNSFIDDKLRMQITDLLYSTKFNNSPGYLYILIEHQSTPLKLMPFRVLKYIIAIMEHHLNTTKEDELPIVYPLIFYTGDKSYNYSTDIFDLFRNKELAQDILYKPYQLVDLSKISDDELKEYLRYGVIARTMKHIYQRDFLPILKNILDELKYIAGLGEKDYIYKLLSYIIEAGNMPDKKEFVNTITTGLSNINEDKIMTTMAEHWKQEGMQKGMQEGYQKGVILAKQQKLDALRAVAKKLLNENMNINQIADITGLSIADIEQP